MYKTSDLTKSVYRTGEVAEILGVTTQTLRVYDKTGKLKMFRSDGGHRMVKREDLLSFLESKGILYDDTQQMKRDVIYARVSSHEQKARGDLDRQATYIIDHVPDLQNPLVLKEVGSGLNDKRKQLLGLVDMVLNDEVRSVYVTYRDRLTRFGYHYLSTVFQAKGVEIVVLNDVSQKRSVENELVEDMMALIASFSGKLYGLRSGKNRRQDA